MKNDHSNVQLVGFNGATLSEFVGAGKYASVIHRFLSVGWREAFSEFYISGAGNDAIDFGLALKSDCTGIFKAADCFDTEGLEQLLRGVSTSIGGLIHDIRWAYRNDGKALQPIFIHGYDYPVPDGRGFLNHTGWLKPPMDKANIDRNLSLRKAVAAFLIDKLNDDVFKPYHSPARQVFHIDSRGTLSVDDGLYKTDWTNEMHPTSAGFSKIVSAKWIPALRKVGIAS